MIVRRIWPSPSGEDFFTGLDRMRREMDRLVGAFEGEAFPGPSPGVFPAVNVTQDESNYYVRAELPGMNADELSLTSTEKRLSLSGQREIEPQHEGTSFHRREREGGTFSRSIVLPAEFDTERVQASYVNGILTVTLPKSEARKPKQIPVKTG